MRYSEAGAVAIEALLRRSRYEVIPMRGVTDDVTFLPPGSTITVTGSPHKGLVATLELSQQLAERSFHIVPHIMARLVRSRDHLSEIMGKLAASRLDEIFIIGGDVPTPEGPYDSAGALIADMANMPDRPRKIGIAAYPGGHPLISNQDLMKALKDKEPFADYMVTQICFDPAVISRWLMTMREQSIQLPVYLGIPGVLKRGKLLEISLRVGVGDSTRFLTNHFSLITRLIRQDLYTPDGLVRMMANSLRNTALNIEGFHIYTFNQCQATERWRQKQARTRI